MGGIAFATKRLVFRFLFRALIWFARFCLLIKHICLFYLFPKGLFELQTMTGCLVLAAVQVQTGHKVALTLSKQLPSSQDTHTHCYEHADVSWCNEKEEMRGGT